MGWLACGFGAGVGFVVSLVDLFSPYILHTPLWTGFLSSLEFYQISLRCSDDLLIHVLTIYRKLAGDSRQWIPI